VSIDSRAHGEKAGRGGIISFLSRCFELGLRGRRRERRYAFIKAHPDWRLEDKTVNEEKEEG
jgi:hypothetical protein